MVVEFGVLGAIEVRAGGRLVDIGHARQTAVLAVLLVEANRTVSAGQLADRVWGDRIPEKVGSTLYSYLSRIRRMLRAAGDVHVRRQAGGYVLSVSPSMVDIHRFRDLIELAGNATDDDRAVTLFDEALGLWRGEPFWQLDSPWLNDVRAYLTAERLAAELDRDDLRLRRGEHAGLLTGLQRRAAEHPLDERVAAQFMLALQRSGRQADALQEYQRLRSRLAGELGVDPGPELRRLHKAILSNDIQPRVGRSRAGGFVPRQLPADVPSFVGRTAEMAALDQAAANVVVIHGTAGVGKTALAVHWGHHAAARFPGGQLYLNLRGLDPDRRPASPGEALAQLLRTLGVDSQRIPHDVDERAGLFRSLVAGQRMLVVLDNAATVDQIRPLLPGTAPSQVVVTSRNHLTGLVVLDGAHTVGLDVLSPDDALTMLSHTIGPGRAEAEAGAVAHLAWLCGYLPLALRVAAGKLVMRPSHTVAAAVAELAGADRLAALEVDGDPRAAVRAVLDLSYHALRTQDRQLFRRLGRIPGPDFTPAVAARLTGVSDDDARRGLTRLAAAHLVESSVPNRYRLHELTRLYCRDRCAADDSADDRDATPAVCWISISRRARAS